MQQYSTSFFSPLYQTILEFFLSQYFRALVNMYFVSYKIVLYLSYKIYIFSLLIKPVRVSHITNSLISYFLNTLHKF